MKAINIFFACAFAAFLGCKTPENVHIEVLIDTTCNNCQQITEYVRGIVRDKMSIGTEGITRKSCIVTVVPFNGQIERPQYPVEIGTAPSFLLRNNRARLDSLDTFFDVRINEVISKGCVDQGDTTKTFFYHALFKSLRELTDSPAQVRVCVVFSDVIENGYLSFYDHREEPDSLVIKYTEIKAELENQYGALPSLQGIELVLLHAPVVRDQHLFDRSREFLKLLVTDMGGTYRFKDFVDQVAGNTAISTI